jgi:coenzyme Q-binding protein COQ10
MTTIRQQRQLPYTCHQLFDLVADIESYPDFIPHYRDARILHEEGGHRVVEQTLRVSGVQIDLRTEAELHRPNSIHVHSRQRPLRSLDIHWRFDPAPIGCRVDYHMDVTLAVPLLSLLGQPWSSQAISRTLTAFEIEAARRYGAEGT